MNKNIVSRIITTMLAVYYSDMISGWWKEYIVVTPGRSPMQR